MHVEECIDIDIHAAYRQLMVYLKSPYTSFIIASVGAT